MVNQVGVEYECLDSTFGNSCPRMGISSNRVEEQKD